MFRHLTALISLILLVVFSSCHTTYPGIKSRIISKSTRYNAGTYSVNTSVLTRPYLTIQGNDITLDFNHATIDGRKITQMPDSFEGIAIHVKDSKNVTIKNLRVHGFKFAILAENVDSLKIISCDFSYNFRPRLLSQWDKEDESDWLYYHHNENDEWKRYGAAIYLKNCDQALVKDVLCQQGFNALLMVHSDSGLVYNNNFSFNSGLGIGMYRCSHNRIMHNKLDWNARGYSHGQYARGQDSAGILLYEQSSHNTIAFNSATHSGDGFFLWAGQYTMDTGKGGCDSNLIYQNDFSHSIANGIEVTFSANWMIGNKLHDCRYGIWGGYSHHSIMNANDIQNCETGIAIEHGRYNEIGKNFFGNNDVSIQLWDRKQQPSDWVYPRVLNTESRHYRISENNFTGTDMAFQFSGTDSIWLKENKFSNVTEIFSNQKETNTFPDTVTDLPQLELPVALPSRLPDGMDVSLEHELPRGRKYIIINEWGPYNFQYPIIVLRRKEVINGVPLLHFEFFGPRGEWKIKSLDDSMIPARLSGYVPGTLVVENADQIPVTALRVYYTGESFIDQFGNKMPKGQEFWLNRQQAINNSQPQSIKSRN